MRTMISKYNELFGTEDIRFFITMNGEKNHCYVNNDSVFRNKVVSWFQTPKFRSLWQTKKIAFQSLDSMNLLLNDKSGTKVFK